jgi:hypothetical protein
VKAVRLGDWKPYRKRFHVAIKKGGTRSHIHVPPLEGKEENNFLIIFHRHKWEKPEAKTNSIDNKVAVN